MEEEDSTAEEDSTEVAAVTVAAVTDSGSRRFNYGAIKNEED